VSCSSAAEVPTEVREGEVEGAAQERQSLQAGIYEYEPWYREIKAAMGVDA
jgi:hypothetical protein